MASRFGPRGFLALFFIVAAVFVAWVAGWLIVDAAIGHGSTPGNILRIGGGISLSAVSIFFFIAAILTWKSS
jgi:hypothetical protein